MSEFAEKVAIVAGGAQGIGRAVAHTLAGLGARVLIGDVGSLPDGSGQDPLFVAQAAEELGRDGAQVSSLVVDTGQPDAARRLLQSALASYGRVDLGVYSAGFLHDRALLRTTAAELEHVLAVHLLGAIRFTNELARAMISAKTAGSIVLATSSSAFFGSAGQSAMAAAAGGLIGFVKTAATELRRHNIRVNAVVPTARTRLTAQLPLFTSIRPDSLTPEHVAQGICHLLSDAASDVRGEVVGIAGGRIYAFRHAETSGAFLEDSSPPSLSAIAEAWRDVSRPVGARDVSRR
ncbi:MAG: Dehydrogenase [Myxococcaceae bacterium]|nr:Dehydrogenase [Myxococcaceae bacterium]